MVEKSDKEITEAYLKKQNSPWKGLRTSEDVEWENMCDRHLAEIIKKDPDLINRMWNNLLLFK